ncbi:MAG TPA: hypothetical protein VIV63_15155 [Steroidobacteraceae bacterium]
MRHLIGSILAISIAGVAAIAATTALLNAPLHIGPATGQTAPADGSKPATQEIPDAPPPKGASAPEAPAPKGTEGAASVPAGSAADPSKPAAEGEAAEESDTDPYEGIAPEDLPPDLQYDADASVSFPTNT